MYNVATIGKTMDLTFAACARENYKGPGIIFAHLSTLK